MLITVKHLTHRGPQHLCRYSEELRAERSWDRIGVGARLSAPSLLQNGYWVSFQGLKQPGSGVNYPPSSSAKVKERVELYLYSPFGPSWHVPRQTLLFFLEISLKYTWSFPKFSIFLMEGVQMNFSYVAHASLPRNFMFQTVKHVYINLNSNIFQFYTFQHRTVGQNSLIWSEVYFDWTTLLTQKTILKVHNAQKGCSMAHLYVFLGVA
jgi:hypothetical protein